MLREETTRSCFRKKKEITATQNTKTMTAAKGHKFKSVPKKLRHQPKIGMLQSAICAMYVNEDGFVIWKLKGNITTGCGQLHFAISRKFRCGISIQGVSLHTGLFLALKDTTPLIILLWIQHTQNAQCFCCPLEKHCKNRCRIWLYSIKPTNITLTGSASLSTECP